MNYRHAFHAGNFADVLKHVVLTRILTYLALKHKPFRVIDTHAGIGLYDLEADEAARTGEWVDGVGRLDAPLAPECEALLAPYRSVLADMRARYGTGIYPGSPAIIREMLRPSDRGILVELHPADHAVLAARYHQVSNLKALNLDGWQALGAMIPPKEKRGLVLIDPPYEKPGELGRLAREIATAVAKWPGGIYAGWYPIKRQREVDEALAPLTALPRPALRLEMRVSDEYPEPRLIGNGLVIVNPPWTLEDEMRRLLPELATRLAQKPGAGRARIEPLGAAA
ncbi:MAG: 23S rRNA (adenine2030-N6)-methyltransferase [Saliniramus fredricksonii]|uniref:Ribosomal RNA large subunit methyltransferase J n=1 Tax=Saliniramus fredricksonii TaxID=1653334 RepID=A0A0P7X9Y1_9HYPH|nr:23S rRNA (adenine(2030)-N(6))-methyltransferase RlmJ [Saliniramus fredricksonii]KPQ12035.1 MAG: 23S rRNA (adenine2030-N6)-methyltransferase [Saliniramus fredricksonii]SCC81470.1 23S rRNA (adenine2030-N6)-methyltransferase [Saliniramus fredricksonii]